MIHYGKPKELPYYQQMVGKNNAKQGYQRESFEQMFKLLNSDARIILDRAHLGEAIYAKRYRGYDGDYVFELESVQNAQALSNTLLVLLVNNDKELEKKLIDDGDSFDWEQRSTEQDDFARAFWRSKFQHKCIANVGGNGILNSKEGTFIDMDLLADEIVEAYKTSAIHTAVNQRAFGG